MMQVFDADKKLIGVFNDYDDLCEHINARETSKLLEFNACFPDEIWSFVLFTHKRLSYIYPKTLEKSFTKIGKEAFEQDLDLIEISKGNYHNPLQIPVTANVNIEELRRNWCQDYCNAHDYSVVKCQSNFEDHASFNSMSTGNVADSLLERRKEMSFHAQASLYAPPK